MFNAKHFYVIFNPNLLNGSQHKEFNISQAHEFYKQLSARVTSNHESPYLYWGKIMRSSKLPKDQFKIEEARKIIKENKENGLNTHLYISDFNYFWVAKIEDVSKGYDLEYFNNTLDFYKHERDMGCEVEAWFKISDMTLVSRSHKETHQYIGGLYILDERKKKKSLDPYISGLVYPLTVMDDLHDETLFDTNDPLVSTILRDDESFYEKVHTTINKYCIEHNDFKLISPTARDLIIRAEMDFYDDRFHNLESMYFMYYKALEVQLNELVLHYLKENWSEEDIRINFSDKGASTFKTPNFAKLQSKEIHLKDFHKGFSIGHLLNVVFSAEYGDRICSKHTNNHLFKDASAFFQTVMRDLKPFILSKDIIDTRNELVHGSIPNLTKESFKEFRAKILGIGQQSILVKMVQEIRSNEVAKKERKAS